MNTNRICLGSKDHGLSGDTYYFLIQGHDLCWEIEAVRHYEQPFKGPHNMVLGREKWDEIFLDGKSLRALVEEKMPSALDTPC